jgi:hypothetical protein
VGASGSGMPGIVHWQGAFSNWPLYLLLFLILLFSNGHLIKCLYVGLVHSFSTGQRSMSLHFFIASLFIQMELLWIVNCKPRFTMIKKAADIYIDALTDKNCSLQVKALSLRWLHGFMTPLRERLWLMEKTFGSWSCGHFGAT